MKKHKQTRGRNSKVIIEVLTPEERAKMANDPIKAERPKNGEKGERIVIDASKLPCVGFGKIYIIS